MKRILGILFALLALGAPAALWFLSAPVTLSFASPPPRALGAATSVSIRVDSPHGTRRVEAWLEQGGERLPAFERRLPATRFGFRGKREPPETIQLTLGKAKQTALRAGKVRLVFEAEANDFRASAARLEQEFDVIVEPPRLEVDGLQHYINQGGAELVTFRVSGYWTEAGVRVGEHTFRSFPMPGGADENHRFALFVFPWDTPATTVPVVFARPGDGTEVTARFWHKVFPKKFRQRQLDLSDAFLEKVTAEIDPGGAGPLLDRFLRINGELRCQNNAALAELRHKTEPRFLFSLPFKQLSNSKVESQFADRRTYVYQGRKVDEQVHLGFDLSVTKNVPIGAANDGKVVFAGWLGIYGNCVVIDHGYGLQSIYAHLNSMDVKPGDAVRRDQVIGRSGATGLAGGDHLHFSMQIDGVQTNPVEWWDDHWIQDRIRSKVPLAPAQ